MAELSYEEELRYNRQIILKSVDFDGQEKLKDSRMLIVGLGGLGCAASQYLAAAGVGHLTLLDFDTVSLSNLQRQVLHTDSRLNMPKVESAKIALQQINPHVEIETINAQLSEEKLAESYRTLMWYSIVPITWIFVMRSIVVVRKRRSR